MNLTKNVLRIEYKMAANSQWDNKHDACVREASPQRRPTKTIVTPKGKADTTCMCYRSTKGYKLTFFLTHFLFVNLL